jgi:hypothetical protein
MITLSIAYIHLCPPRCLAGMDPFKAAGGNGRGGLHRGSVLILQGKYGKLYMHVIYIYNIYIVHI